MMILLKLGNSMGFITLFSMLLQMFEIKNNFKNNSIEINDTSKIVSLKLQGNMNKNKALKYRKQNWDKMQGETDKFIIREHLIIYQQLKVKQTEIIKILI